MVVVDDVDDGDDGYLFEVYWVGNDYDEDGRVFILFIFYFVLFLVVVLVLWGVVILGFE